MPLRRYLRPGQGMTGWRHQTDPSPIILVIRTFLYEIHTMKGTEFVRKLRRLAKERGLDFSHEARHGKGSHGQLLFGDRLTTVKDPKKEIGPGLLHAMLSQLGLTRGDLS